MYNIRSELNLSGRRKLNYNDALEKLEKYGQEHLLKYYGELSDDEKSHLLKDIENLDAEKISSLYRELVAEKKSETEEKSELQSISSDDIRDFTEEEKKNLIQIGMEELKKGTVGVLQVAGGQGSRLGFDGPKGTFSVGLPSGKELFKLHGERILSLSKKAGRPIPWYIMTSPENNDATVSFFKDNDYFGLEKESVKFFPQQVFPSVDTNGKIFMDSKCSVSKNPNGSGGCFTSLYEAGLLKEMEYMGIKYIFFCGVDNILLRPADPLFIGYAVKKGYDIASKSVRKKSPSEKVGVFTYRNGKPSIIEYIELSPAMAEEKDTNGKLRFGSGNVLMHIFRIDFIRRALEKNTKYYAQHKKIKHMGNDGQEVSPTEPNGYKFESLYFDIFSEADDMAVLDIVREEEFAPVKNREGQDSVETAREMYMNLTTSWLENMGIETEEKIEISPLLSVYGDDLDHNYITERLKEKKNYID